MTDDEPTPERFDPVDEQLLREMPELAALIAGEKECLRCHKTQPLTDFHVNNGRADGRQVWCKSCSSVAGKVQHKRYCYGLEPGMFDELLAAQGGACAVCRTTEPGERGWHVDHDHSCCPEAKTCGKCLRGVLCARCNLRVIPVLEGDLLEPGLAYLAAHRVE